jgi:hypothetical protein
MEQVPQQASVFLPSTFEILFCEESLNETSNPVDTVPVFRLVSLRNREKYFAEISKQQKYTIIL